jgi:hypothetical protein
MTLELGTMQRRSPPAAKKNVSAAAAPRERSRFRQRAKALDLTRLLSSGSGHITPQLSGGALRCPARRMCIMKWSTCGAHALPYDRPLQLLVRRLAQPALTPTRGTHHSHSTPEAGTHELPATT